MQTRKGTPRGKKAEKRCSFCQVNPRRPNQRTCRACHAEYMRRSRAEYKASMEIPQ